MTNTVGCAIRRSIAACTSRSDSVSSALVAFEIRIGIAQQPRRYPMRAAVPAGEPRTAPPSRVL